MWKLQTYAAGSAVTFAALYLHNYVLTDVNCRLLIVPFRQSQPSVQGSGGHRDIRPERQRPGAGEAVHNRHV